MAVENRQKVINHFQLLLCCWIGNCIIIIINLLNLIKRLQKCDLSDSFFRISDNNFAKMSSIVTEYITSIIFNFN